MLTLASMLKRTLRCFGPQRAIANAGGGFTWTEFGDRVARAAVVLKALGVRRGERYALICRNSFRCAELMHAGYWMGAIPVPINFRLAPPEIAYILDNAGCDLTVVESEFSKTLDTDALASRAVNAHLVGGADDGWSRYETMLAEADPAPLDESAGEDDEALLIYTGGTTGRAKGVPLSHRNVVANGMQIGLVTAPLSDDVFLHVAPMFHSADLLATPWTLAGAAHLYLPKFTSEAVFRAIEDFGITTSMLTPTMIIVMLRDPDFERYDISTLRQVIYGSSPMAAEWIRKAVERFEGVEFIQAYGLTETAPLLTMLPMAEHMRAIDGGKDEVLRSLGQPLVGVDLKLVDADGAEVPTGGIGEIIVRGPNVAQRYLKRPEATAEAFREGWFCTGDIGRLDDRGRLYLLDRKKDMIITGGELVYSLEVEAALYEHPGVQECAVVGVPDEVYGEALLAAIVPAEGAGVTDQEMIAHCRGRIAGYKIPRRYAFFVELPKSAMNKILKNELRRLYGSQGEAGGSPQ
jgi:long-chain acyl-CoA synthetase